METRLTLAGHAARFAHPIFAPLRPCLERLVDARGDDEVLELLNGLAIEHGVCTERGKLLRFVPPVRAGAYYELHLFETGEAATRAGNLHDLFNALVWLTYPRTKARINAMHADWLAREPGRRGPLRDLLTILDEGGAIVRCDDALLNDALRGHRWKELFWACRDRLSSMMHVEVLGHAVLEKALDPWPGITCKAIVLPTGPDPDAAAAAWLARRVGSDSPRSLASFPLFGLPGWLPQTGRADFYDDRRWFRPRAAAAHG